MRSISPQLLSAVLAFAVCCSSRSGAKIDRNGLSTLLDPVFASGMKKENIPGAAFVLVKDGDVIVAKCYGVADVASGRRVEPETTIFPIASITKVFTATAIMQLVDSGQLDLHNDVNRYLTSLQVPKTYPEPITVAHLLTHTSGLDEIPGRRVKSVSDVVPLHEFLKDRLVRVHPPGKMTSYSSYGIALAGVILSDTSDQSYEDYLSAHIWKPLGMNRTWLTIPPDQHKNLASAYELDKGKPVAVPYEIYQTPQTASIVSTVTDMAKFMVAHLQKGRFQGTRILSEHAAGEMQRQHGTMHPRIPGWGYGWQLANTNGRRIVAHGGDIGGFSAQMVLLPDENVGFFVVHHLEGTNLRYTVERTILDRYFPEVRSREVEKRENLNPDELGRFAGKYRANNFCHSCPDAGPNVQDFEVKANTDGSITVWDQKWFPVEPLYFVNEKGNRHIGFKEDAKGEIVALTAGSWKVLERIPLENESHHAQRDYQRDEH
jgi:CubicO group peptidase (beta-lactamase class C family)